MQRYLADISRRPTALGQKMLEEAKRRGITTFAKLAKAVHVDMDSIEALLLKGGRPNTRTSERYRVFLHLTGRSLEELLGDIMPAPFQASEPTVAAGGGALAASASSGRRPAITIPPSPSDALGLHSHLTSLLQRQEALVRTNAILGDELKTALQQVRAIHRLIADTEAEPAMKEFLAASPHARKVAIDVIRAINQQSADKPSASSAAGSSARPAKRRAGKGKKP